MSRSIHQRATRLVLSLVLIAAASAHANSSQTHVVVGLDDIAVDRLAIQDAIDGARAGDTVELQGTFQLDGVSIVLETSRLTVTGQALDNDGDGAINEDGVDGLDNDGDGLIDEDDWDAVLQGVDDGGGGPAGDAFPNRFNDGIEILGFDDELEKIEIRDIRFTRLNRSIYLFPDYDDAGTIFVCDSVSPTAGELDDLEIEGNAFDNSNRGVELLGRVSDLSIEDNRFTNISSQAVVMFGQGIGCAEADGSIVQVLPIGTPEKVRVKGNRVTGGFIGVLSQVSEKTSITCNQLNGQVLGVISLEDEKLSLARNDVDGAFIGLLGSFETRVTGPASDNKFKNNTLSNNFFGAVIDCETTGYKIAGNSFLGSAFTDIFLDGTSPGGSCADDGLGDSFENKVIANAGTTVLDFGLDNEVIVDDDDSDSDSDCYDDSDSDSDSD